MSPSVFMETWYFTFSSIWPFPHNVMMSVSETVEWLAVALVWMRQRPITSKINGRQRCWIWLRDQNWLNSILQLHKTKIIIYKIILKYKKVECFILFIIYIVFVYVSVSRKGTHFLAAAEKSGSPSPRFQPKQLKKENFLQPFWSSFRVRERQQTNSSQDPQSTPPTKDRADTEFNKTGGNTANPINAQ